MYVLTITKRYAKCIHCKRNSGCRPRGLCTTCYRKPDILSLYPIASKYARRGLAGGTRWRTEPDSLPLPPEPTSAIPGSLEKMLVMQNRALQGYSIFHPLDYVDRDL